MPDIMTPEERSERMARVTEQLGSWFAKEEPSLGAMEQQVLQTVKELGNSLLAALTALRAPLCWL